MDEQVGVALMCEAGQVQRGGQPFAAARQQLSLVSQTHSFQTHLENVGSKIQGVSLIFFHLVFGVFNPLKGIPERE